MNDDKSKDGYKILNIEKKVDLDDPLSPSPLDTKISLADIHIRIQKRDARHCITILEGLRFQPGDTKTKDEERLLREIKKMNFCSGHIVREKEKGCPLEHSVFCFTGDHRNTIASYLIEKRKVDKKAIKIHGY